MDYIANRVSTIQIGYRLGRPFVFLSPYSNKKVYKILNILQENGYISMYKPVYNSENKTTQVCVYLKYGAAGEKALQTIARVSTQGRRIYCSTRNLWKPASRTGCYILSTPQGRIRDAEAREKNIGGEVLISVL